MDDFVVPLRARWVRRVLSLGGPFGPPFVSPTCKETVMSIEKMPKKKRLPYGEYVERVVSKKKKSSPRKEREQFVPIEE